MRIVLVDSLNDVQVTRDPRLATGDPCLAVTAFTVYPLSRGHIDITGPDLGDPLDFEHGFFTDAGDIDLKKHIWSYNKQREVIRRSPSYRGEMAHSHPPFAPGSEAANVELDGPLPAGVPDIEYFADDDAVLEKWLRNNVGTTWHALGTCKMLPRDQNGVVDGSLSVYGFEGLKIADLSIVPRNVAANTENTALPVGKRAADISIKELGLGSV
ncbi:alcohol oxidase [Diaporthe eres]|nr:alcohol oxidase [Diaporthe eres]